MVEDRSFDFDSEAGSDNKQASVAARQDKFKDPRWLAEQEMITAQNVEKAIFQQKQGYKQNERQRPQSESDIYLAELREKNRSDPTKTEAPAAANATIIRSQRKAAKIGNEL